MDIKDKKRLISSNDLELTLKRQCELLDFSRATYYYKDRSLNPEDYKVLRKIDEVFTEHPYYGTRRMMHALRVDGYKVGRKRLRRYYEVLGIKAIYPKMNLSKRNQAHKVYPYLLKDLEVKKPKQVWCSDVTYIRLKQGFVYLVAIMDWYSRYILSWRVSITLHHDFCVEALCEAMEKYGRPEIFNSDQGVQYTCHDFTKVLEGKGVQISMDSKGRALDNVFIERFWRSLKQEKIYRMDLETVKHAK